MDIVRSKHFQAYVQDLFVGCAARTKAMAKEKALALFKDSYYEDANMLSYIINSIFPQTKPVDDIYHFITKDDFTHTDIVSYLTWNPGAMILKIDKNYEPNFTFDNKYFKHGHVDHPQGKVNCYGGYKHFGDSLCTIGLSGALMDMYNFGRVSKHDAGFVNQEVYAESI